MISVVPTAAAGASEGRNVMLLYSGGVLVILHNLQWRVSGKGHQMNPSTLKRVGLFVSLIANMQREKKVMKRE